MQIIKVGHIGRGTRLHLDIDGVSGCKSGSRKIHSVRDLDVANATMVCKKCEDKVISLINMNEMDVMRSGGEWTSWGRAIIRKGIAIIDVFDERRTPERKAEAASVIESVRKFLADGLDSSVRMVDPFIIEPIETVLVDENQMSLFSPTFCS